MHKKVLETNITREIKNFKTGEIYRLEGAKNIVCTNKDIQKITEICSHKESL